MSSERLSTTTAAPDDVLLLRRVQAIADFSAVKEQEITFKTGDVFAFFAGDKDSGWAQGEKDGKVGWFPQGYVRFLEGADLTSHLQEEVCHSGIMLKSYIFFYFVVLCLDFSSLDAHQTIFPFVQCSSTISRCAAPLLPAQIDSSLTLVFGLCLGSRYVAQEKALKEKEEELKKQISEIQTKIKEIRRKRRPLLVHLSSSTGSQ